MFLIVLLSLFATCTTAEDKDSALTRLTDIDGAETFINSSEVVVIGFFEGEKSRGYKEFMKAVAEEKSVPIALCSEKEVWAHYKIESDTISLFRKVDQFRDDFKVSEAKKLDSDGISHFININDLRYLTEYNQVSAVGLFQSKVKVHVLLFVSRGSNDYGRLKKRMRDLAPEYTGKFLFVLINGALQSNARAMNYFGLKSGDLPRVGLYDADLDKRWLMPKGEISTEKVKAFCESYLEGELQKQKEAGQPDPKSEL
ncbi:endoplasmic reticulum resident protein 27 [Chanos chanos]|uniref:protein disulfide-isomerase n=1 Tax=Chanos chanos TaxID=29144 RepID=A0A6J2W2I7_CHACN|nr:endoplasmic reticulum resident protein 27 [Chanos chanos]